MRTSLEMKRNFTIYLDQNLLGHLRAGEPKNEKLSRVLSDFRERGGIFVYSDVHVEECRAFYDPEQYVRVLDEIGAYYIEPTNNLEENFAVSSGKAADLLLSEPDFASKSLALLRNQMTLSQFALGWLGEVEADELKRELVADIDLWATEVERETFGTMTASSIREQLLGPLSSLDLNQLRHESLAQQPQTEREWNERFSKIDRLTPHEVVHFIFSEIGHEASQYLSGKFPENTWPNGPYREKGALTGLTFLLFTQGVGRDSKVKRGSQSERRKRLRAQFRDCQHIEEAARCDLFLSNDARAIDLAQAAYAYSGANTAAKQVYFQSEK